MSFTAAMAFFLAQAASGEAAPAPTRPPRLPTRSQLEDQVKEQFANTDANKDGKVDKAEAEKAHAAKIAAMDAQRSKQLAGAFAKIDANSDGSISQQEFEAASRPQAAPKEAWFEDNDIDRNGSVVLNEAIAKAQRNFDSVDSNGNGVISSEELRASRGQRRISSK